MRTRLIRVGNSRGIRIPKPMLNEAGLEDVIQLRVEKGRLIIVPDRAARRGWAEAFAKAAEHATDPVLLSGFSNTFDKDEWTW